MSSAVLKLDNVTGKGFGFKLKDINMEIYPGYIYGLMGENGSGKTTLMNYILNQRKYSGKILLNGEDINSNFVDSMNKIGFVSEDNYFFENLSGVENADILGAFYKGFDKELFMTYMSQMEVSTGKSLINLSRGDKLKFQLAFAIAHKPALYLLDEVTAGMDSVFRQDFFKILQKLIVDEEVAILMTSHIASEMEMKTDYVGIMENGQLVKFGESIEIINK